MFKSIFKGGRSGRKASISHSRSKKGENPLLLMPSEPEDSSQGKNVEDVVLANAERQLYQHKMPDRDRDMGDMLQEHTAGTVFPGVAILDEPTNTLESRYRRMTRLQPRVNKRQMNVPDHITVKLRDEVEKFPMSDIVKLTSKQQRDTSYEYVLIKRAALIFSPLSSFIDSHSDVIVSIVDSRKRGEQVVRSLRLQDNKFYKGEFVLDYSFPKESSEKVVLTFSQEVPTFNTGEQWGVCQLFLELEESDFPVTQAFQETIGQAAVTTSMLQEYKFHPAHLNVAMRDSQLEQLRELYKDGDIVDDTEPQHERYKLSSYPKSGAEALKSQRQGAPNIVRQPESLSGWGMVRRGKMPKLPAYQASVDPEDDGGQEDSTAEKLARMNMISNLAAAKQPIPMQIHPKNQASKEKPIEIATSLPSPKQSSKNVAFTPVGGAEEQKTPPSTIAEGVPCSRRSSESGTSIRLSPMADLNLPTVD